MNEQAYEQLTLFPEDSLVSLLVKQVNKKDLMMRTVETYFIL